jgi:hypothetical protein
MINALRLSPRSKSFANQRNVTKQYPCRPLQRQCARLVLERTIWNDLREHISANAPRVTLPSPSCDFMWSFSSNPCANTLPHSRQLTVFSLLFPVCVRLTWLSWAACDAKALPQCLHCKRTTCRPIEHILSMYKIL